MLYVLYTLCVLCIILVFCIIHVIYDRPMWIIYNVCSVLNFMLYVSMGVCTRARACVCMCVCKMETDWLITTLFTAHCGKSTVCVLLNLFIIKPVYYYKTYELYWTNEWLYIYAIRLYRRVTLLYLCLIISQ